MFSKGILYSLFFLLISSTANADDSPNFYFSSADLTTQLTQKTVRQIYHDSTGYLWIVTQEGINRYDGYQMLHFVHEPRNDDSLSNSNVFAILEDHQHRLWIATDGGGLNLFNAAKQTFTAFKEADNSATAPTSNRILSLFLDAQNYIWIGYRNGNFSRFNPDDKTFEHFNIRELVPELKKDAGIVSIVEDDNFLWLASSENGLFKFDKKSHSMERLYSGSKSPFFSDSLKHLFVDTQQRLWVASADAGVSVTDPQKLQFSNWQYDANQADSLPSNLAQTIYQDRQQRIWIGTDAGVAVWDGKNSFTSFTTTDGLTDNNTLSIQQDSTGLIWLGTLNGITKSIEVPFEHIDKGLSNNAVLGFAETDSSAGESSIWIASYTGLTQLDSNGDVLQVINKETQTSLRDARVTAVLGKDNELWFGTRRAGLGRLNVDNNDIQFFSHDPENPSSLSFNGVTSVFSDNGGNLWVATFGGGLNYLPAGSDQFIHYRYDENDPNSLNSDKVLAVYQLADGTIVVGTVSGFNLLDQASGHFRRIEQNPDVIDSLSASMAWAFYQDSKGQLWIGTQGGGLNKWSPEDMQAFNNKFTQYDSFSGLPSSHVYAILEDDSGNLWLGSPAGLTRLNTENGKIRHFDRSQGFKESEVNWGASFKDSQGYMYFGGPTGAIRFHPDDIKDSEIVPPVVVVRIKKLNEQVWFDVPYQQLQELELGYKDYFISFEFASLDFNAPGLNEYRYKLEGLDSDWIELENRRLATFTNLPAGNYTLRVQASNNQGLWNTEGVVLPINVLPPPWKTVWAYSLYSLIVVLIVLNTIWKYRRKRLAEIQQLLDLEEKVEERTKELRHANAQLETSMQETEKARKLAEQASKEKSDFLAIMSHEIRTPMNGVLGMTEVLLSSELKPKQQHFAQLVYRSGRLLLDLLNNILDFSKLEAGKATLESVPVDLEALVEEVCDLFSESAYNKGLYVNAILSPEPLPEVYADPARLRQIIANLTSNAIKFTEHGEVNVSIRRVPCYQAHNNSSEQASPHSGFEIRVQDTGIGMAPDRQQKVFEMFTQADASTTRKYGGTGLGLAICRQLTTLMGGNIDVQSKLGEGSSFTLEVDLPLYQKPIIETLLSSTAPTVHLVNLKGGLGLALSNMLSKLGVTAVHVQRVNGQLASAKNGLWISLSEYESAIKNAQIPMQKWICLLPSSQWQEHDKRNILPLPIHLKDLQDSLNKALGVKTLDRQVSNNEYPNHQKFNANILVAEDSLTNQEVAKSMLGMLGCEAWLADNGAEAVEQININQPDLVLMDCQMPIMDGYQATTEIRKKWPNIPIVALTAGMGDDLRQQCLGVGMNEVMTKPFSLRELEQTLTRFLGAPSQPPKNEQGENESLEFDSQNSHAQNNHSRDNLVTQNSEATDDELASQLIDMATVETLLKISRDTGNPVFVRVLDAFIQEAEKLIAQLFEQVNSPELNLSEVAEIAHALKSMSGNSGAKALYEICRELESKSKQQQSEGVDTLAQNIQATFILSCEKLETFRNVG
ncbi:MAG: two-component regulator propeller domain-containing protein [Aliiglaciecola sp.]|uniref:hybrid sensor histidine kinase/response regulator n=1 Tax=Aliiglaciecola sp. TaxID=1872441 RepID=UPI003299AD5E